MASGNKFPLIVIGVVLLLLPGLVALNQKRSGSVAGGVLEYRGNGYKLSYPQNWKLDNTVQKIPAVIIADPQGHVQLYIQTQYDPALTSGSGKTAVIKNLTDSYRQSSGYSVYSTSDKEINGNPAFLVTGTFKEDGGIQEFQEYTIFGKSGDFYTLRINNKPGEGAKAAEPIINSLTITGPEESELRARSLVEKIGEVRDFKKQVEKSKKSRFAVRIDREPTAAEPYYVAQVYEAFPDHMTTFNWYRVDPKTWGVERQDLATDTWEKVK